MVEFHAVLNGRRRSRAIQNSEQGVQPVEHRLLKQRVHDLDWNDLDLICQIAQSTSLRHAAKIAKLSVNTIRARVERLESAIGTPVFFRHHDGISLTSSGVEVLKFALEVQSLRSALQRELEAERRHASDQISICCSEGVNEFWLMSMLAKLRNELDGRVISLSSQVDQQKIHNDDYDIRLGFSRPNDLNMVISKVATVHCILFASPEYIASYGAPESLDDLKGHAYVAQVAPGIEDNAINLFVGSTMADELVALKVNTSVSLYHAVANGTAIAALPTFASVMSRHVVPLDLPVRLKFDLWLSFNRSARKSLSIRTVIDWVRKCFDPDLYPWFADRFVHPRDFGPYLHNVNRRDEFDHLIVALHQTNTPETEAPI
jgi:DNA-binding transcriptional LysR family regulator